MRFYISTDPAAVARCGVEECPECGALIAPDAYLKHRDWHGDSIFDDALASHIETRHGADDSLVTTENIGDIIEEKVPAMISEAIETHRDEVSHA